MGWSELEAKGIKPYYKDDAVFIIHSDCHLVLPLIPDKKSLIMARLKRFISFLICSTCDYPCEVNTVCRFGKWVYINLTSPN